MAAGKTTTAKAKPAEVTETVQDTLTGEETVRPPAEPKTRKPRDSGRMLMEVIDDLPADTSTRGGGAAFAEAFGVLRKMTEDGDETVWGVDENATTPKWTAVKEYGNASGAKTHIKEMRGLGKNGSGKTRAYAAGFEFTDRKFTREVDGVKVKTSILYARYIGA